MKTSDQQGVGGRQGSTHPPAGGGGYPDICTDSELTIGAKKNRADPRVTDPRFLALVEMGMTDRWIRIAREIGMDNFLFVWEVLDESRSGTNVLVSIPRITRYLRFMRNRLIEQMVRTQTPSHVIQRRLQVELNEALTIRHINRLRERLQPGGSSA